MVDSSGLNLKLIDGGGPEFELAFGPSVSPDGSRIAYAAYTESGWFPWNEGTDTWDIVTAKPDGSDKLIIQDDDEYAYSYDPVWSPDGDSIVFRWDARGLGLVKGEDSESRYLLDPSAFEWSYTQWRPSFSPDGSQFAFSTSGVSGALTGAIYVVGVEGEGLHRLTGDEEWFLGSPAWSPDGRNIAFTKNAGSQSRDGIPSLPTIGIWVVGLDGSEPREVVAFDSTSSSLNPLATDISWSPDGSELLLGRYIVKADGSESQWLPGFGREASWSPDGSRLALVGRPNVAVALYTVAPDGTDPRVLVEWDENGEPVAAGGKPLRE